jgi:hypothetical protein
LLSVDPLRFIADQQKGKSIFPLRSVRLAEFFPKAATAVLTASITDIFGLLTI